MSATVPEWAPAYPVRGDLALFRVSASALGATPDWSCSEQLAYKARPAAYLDAPYSQSTRPEFESFAMGLVRDVMLRSLGAVDADGPAVSPALALDQLTTGGKWEPESLQAAKSAVNGYFEVFKRLRAQPGWDDARFASAMVTGEQIGDTTIEWFAWGIHVVRDDQRIRETHVLRWRAGGRSADPARVAATARNLADGFVPKPAKWALAFNPMPTQPSAPERVIVREIGLLDASDEVLFDDVPDAARRRFAEVVPQRLAIFIGGVGNPGSRCAGCGVFELCPHPLREPGILGVAGRSPWLRPLTPGDLSSHRTCPAQFHLRRELGLPLRVPETGGAGQRGTLVHAWLAAAHDRDARCGQVDLPATGLGEVAESLGWTQAEYAVARPFLLHHLDTCPLADAGVGGVVSELALTVIDTDVNVVFSTRFDLAARLSDGGRLVRETKTINPRQLPEAESELIDLFPQVAFPIVALAGGIDPLSARSTGEALTGRVELELLNDDYSSVVAFDIADPDVVIAARVALAQQLDVLIHDRVHPAYPGTQCRWCPVSDWCPAKSEVEIKLSESLVEEPAQVLDTLALIARAVAGSEPAGEDDVPF